MKMKPIYAAGIHHSVYRGIDAAKSGGNWSKSANNLLSPQRWRDLVFTVDYCNEKEFRNPFVENFG